MSSISCNLTNSFSFSPTSDDRLTKNKRENLQVHNRENLSKGDINLNIIDHAQFQNKLILLNQKIHNYALSILQTEFSKMITEIPYCLTTTGSDGRYEKINPHSSLELILIVPSKEKTTELSAKINKIIVAHKDLFFSNVEIKCLETDDLIDTLGLTEDSISHRPFPTRSLDAMYLAGSDIVYKQYKHLFFEQVKTHYHAISKFNKGNVKPAVVLLKKTLSGNLTNHLDIKAGKIFYDNSNPKKAILATKYPLLRVVQYTLAMHILKQIIVGKMTEELFRELPVNTVDRIQWLHNQKLIDLDDKQVVLLCRAYNLSLFWFKQSQKQFENEKIKELNVSSEDLKNVSQIIFDFSQIKNLD